MTDSPARPLSAPAATRPATVPITAPVQQQPRRPRRPDAARA
ncbi:hypothetical protein [Kitasatospora sp. NPDC001132]